MARDDRVQRFFGRNFLPNAAIRIFFVSVFLGGCAKDDEMVKRQTIEKAHKICPSSRDVDKGEDDGAISG